MSSPEVPDYDKSFSEPQAIEYMQKALQKLKEFQDSSNFNIVYKIFKSISQSYFDLKSHLKALSNVMLSLKYVSITSNYIGKFSKKGYFANNDVWFSTYYALQGLWNYCDGYQKIANEIVLTDLPQYLISNVLHRPYLNGMQNTNIKYIIKASISIIHNIVRCPGNGEKFQITELKNVLVGLIKNNYDEFIVLISILTLACLVNESELHLLEEGKNATKALIMKIQAAFESDSKRVNGFAIWELVNGLKCVSANDNLKKTIATENAIKLIFDILKTSTCDNDIEKCLGVLWNLCFDKEIKMILVEDFDLRAVIGRYENHELSKIKKCCDGILWLIDEKLQSKQRIKSANLSKIKPSKTSWKFDVFISYSWSNKPMILSIRDFLLQSNIKIWIDIDQMKGSTLESMADGIENSNIFIMAISEAYRTSPNCRTEAEYAFSLGKPIIPLIVEMKYKPTSWLGIIMGSKTYYEFSKRRKFELSFRGLLENVNSIIQNDEGKTVTKIVVPVVQNAIHQPMVIETPKFPSLHTWSSKNVENWLVKNGLGHLKTKFVNFDGKLLCSLIDVNCKSRKYLYEALKIEFGIKFTDLLKLNFAINGICQ